MVADVIWQEAEAFEQTGGWSNDSQHVDLMGSPYLLATGVGRPVADAVTTVSVRRAGAYTLWVRCRDWYPSHSPGQFQVLVGGKASPVTFGKAKGDAWQWVSGGTFDLQAGEVELRLQDLTGWWGRCDCIVLTTGSFRPSNDKQELAEQRREHAGVSPDLTDRGPYDLVVVGGGPAGIGAAVAAARHGVKVALIQDRPVLGGNASSEIMVPPQGSGVTGLAEELYPTRAWDHFADSDHARRVVTAEAGLSLFLNTRATGVERRDDTTIAAVIALDVLSGQRIRFPASLFADCTGHGWIGYYAGAAWRSGTEARSEFGESLAPEEANPHTMGNNLYRADFRDMGRPDPFETPAWAYQFDSADDFLKPVPRVKEVVRPEAFDRATRGPGRPVPATGPHRGGAFTWSVEVGGDRDLLGDAETIRDELFRLHVGLWGYAKNHDPKGKVENSTLRLVWLNYVPGTRESRRLMGDYLVTQKDYDEDQHLPDVVAFTTWGIDDHQPYGFFTKGIDAIHVYGGKTVGLPYRSLYSRDLDNLFMAGRCMSASHLGMAGVRVMRPMMATGQAVGTAAAIAIHHETTPRGVYREHLVALQQALLRDGCRLPGVPNTDPLDLARAATTSHPIVNNGWDGESKPGSNAAPWREGMPVELKLREPATVACVHLSLADRLNTVAFTVEGLVDGEWTELCRYSGQTPQRRYVLNFEAVEAEAVRLGLLGSSSPVSVTEVRLYAEPGRETALGLPYPVGYPPVQRDQVPRSPGVARIGAVKLSQERLDVSHGRFGNRLLTRGETVE